MPLTDPNLENDTPTTLKTSIWRTGHGTGSVFIDMTNRKESKVEFLTLVSDQYPTRIGVLTQQVGSLRFAEINFHPEDAAIGKILKDGLKLKDNTVIIPCRALDAHMEVTRLRLSNLPFLNKAELLKGLKNSLSPFGEILDVGILVEPKTRTYMCAGYAIINTISTNDKVQFDNLTHLIPWDGDDKSSFYAVWNKMPPYFRYCHVEGHVVGDCDQRRTRLSCWNCSETGHRAAMCPRDRPSKKTRSVPNAPIIVPAISKIDLPSISTEEVVPSDNTSLTMVEGPPTPASSSQDSGQPLSVNPKAPILLEDFVTTASFKRSKAPQPTARRVLKKRPLKGQQNRDINGTFQTSYTTDTVDSDGIYRDMDGILLDNVVETDYTEDNHNQDTQDGNQDETPSDATDGSNTSITQHDQ